ncbi:MAG: hypothetical protein ABL952_02750 [Pyrinomonadaceae bacterium]
MTKVEGAEKAMNFFWPDYRVEVYGWTNRFLWASHCTDKQDHAEDITQLVADELHKELIRLATGEREDIDNLKGWLWTVTRNRFLRHLRVDHLDGRLHSIDDWEEWKLRDLERSELRGHFSPLAEDVQHRLETTESIAIANNTLLELDLYDQWIIEERRENKRSYEWIATSLDISVVAARKRYSNAMKKFYLNYLENGGQEL